MLKGLIAKLKEKPPGDHFIERPLWYLNLMLFYWYSRAVFYVVLVPALFAIDYVPWFGNFVFACAAAVPIWLWKLLALKLLINYIWWAYLRKRAVKFRWVERRRLVFFLSRYRGRFRLRGAVWKWEFFKLPDWYLYRIRQGLEYLPDKEGAYRRMLWRVWRPFRGYVGEYFFSGSPLILTENSKDLDNSYLYHEARLGRLSRSLKKFIRILVLFKNFFLFYFN